MPISHACLTQRVPRGPHQYNAHGHDVYKRRAEYVMSQFDALPPEWRALVHEFGNKPIRLYAKRVPFKKAQMQCLGTVLDLSDLGL